MTVKITEAESYSLIPLKGAYRKIVFYIDFEKHMKQNCTVAYRAIAGGHHTQRHQIQEFLRLTKTILYENIAKHVAFDDIAIQIRHNFSQGLKRNTSLNRSNQTCF